ncbi:hypothetical protein CEXT_462351 [Caerostris extrusa]|uniref:Uncharacterized protein n=1 Tax=Caerostris extrusa TaxID=172846 RepID=A0AAV4U0V4_CAEEX|nr:hypothetical protein CEXT_462351 [Caerostris extrusa]
MLIYIVIPLQLKTNSSGMISPSVYEALKDIPGLHVYLKDEIPEHYHIKHNRLTLPILLVASKNYYIRGLDIPGKSIPTGSSISLGAHGYDPYEVPDMRGIFFARGPGLKKNYISPPLQMVDIYSILCELLGIEPLPNNGTKKHHKRNRCSSVLCCRQTCTIQHTTGCSWSLYHSLCTSASLYHVSNVIE